MRVNSKEMAKTITQTSEMYHQKCHQIIESQHMAKINDNNKQLTPISQR